MTNYEEQIVDFWTKENIFQKSIENNKLNEPFVFYDGPPFATGLPHYGHILSGNIKDTIGRWATIKGFFVPRRAGWDTHGLPIEYEIEKKLGIKTKTQITEFGIGNYNEACREIVMTYSNEWKATMNRIGRWVDFDNDYKTMDISYMSKVWSVFSKIYNKNLIYEGVKIMPYSVTCTTPLSNFEATSNYQDVVDKTVIVKFKINVNTTCNEYILSWTTTPWTLPAHYSLCVNKNIKYCAVFIEHDLYYLAKSRLDFLKNTLKVENLVIFKEMMGSDLVGIRYIPPYNFVNTDYQVIADDFVKDDSGTGIVHIAPAFGEDDYRVCIENKIITKELNSLYIHIDESGKGINCGKFTDLFYWDINKNVLKEIQQNNFSLVIFDYRHSYPFCWRSDTPLIYKAVKCWFLNVESIKEQMIELNKNINWIPEHVGKTRFHNWLEGTKDWCISRNRYWGCPIPIWRNDNDIIVINSKEHLEELTGQKITDLHRHYVDILKININGKMYTRDETVLDCWFESGCVPFATPDNNFPADFIAEGLDQTRGWFYTLLIIGTILENKSPYKNVIVNGLVLASDGKKMSKRLQNYPDPLEIVNKYGADALRYYLIMSPASMGEELRFKEDEVKEIPQRIIIPLLNSLAFFQVHLTLFCKNKEFIEIESDLPFDKWILKETFDFITKYSSSLNSYKINPINNILVKFIDNLNNNYIRLNRDILKGKEGIENSQKSLSTLKKVLNIISIYLSPILPFLCENIFQQIGNKSKPSVHLLNINDFNIQKYNMKDIDIDMIETMLKVIDMIRSIRNTNNIQLKKPVKEIIIYGEEDNLNLLKKTESYIIKEGNILDISWEKWEATTYYYKYLINNKNAGTLFKSNIKVFEKFVSNLTQDILENLYNGGFTKFSINNEDYLIGSDLIKILQTIPDDFNTDYKIKEDVNNKIKIKLNIKMDENTNELFIAKNIATTFQKLRKEGNYKVFDNLRLIIKENKFKDIITKHMEYIMKTTRCKIDILENIDLFDFYKTVEINEEVCEFYLQKV